MAFQVSPGVVVQEVDNTTIIPNVSTSIGGVVIQSTKGPVDQIVELSSENELVEIFGKPTSGNASSWFSAANFLKYSGALKVVRAVHYDGSPENAANAKNSSGSAGVYVPNGSVWEDDLPSAVGLWAARTPGTWGDTLKVEMCTSAAAFTGIPETTEILGQIQSVDFSTGGTGYDNGTHILPITEGNGIDGSVTVIVAGNIVTSVTLLTSGSGYTVNSVSPFDTSLTIDIPDAIAGTGTGFVGTMIVADISHVSNVDPWEYAHRFDAAPGTSEYAAAQGGSNDEMHIVVIDEDGKITGAAGTVLEDFAFLSKASDARSVTGVNNYYKDVIFRSSNYIYWMEHETKMLDETTTITPAFGSASSSTFSDATEVYPLSLTGGVDGDPGDGDFGRGWDLFEDADTVDVNLLVAGPGNATHAQNVMDIADGRKDCVAFISPPVGDVVGVPSSPTQTTNIKTFFEDLNSSSYSVFDSGWKKQYDPYNDNDVWVPLNGDMAGLCANTDDVADPWFSPAGESRGNIKSVIKLAFNPTKTQRDTLYKSRINPVVTFPGKGTLLWGDKTAQKKASAFDRINVRRLFIVLEKAIAKASESQLFELNDDITRANFRAMVEPFLRDVQGRRGITDFKVVCDTTNNTGDVIDRNEFRGDIYIKPTRSINFIQLRFIATRTGDSFDEIGG